LRALTWTPLALLTMELPPACGAGLLAPNAVRPPLEPAENPNDEWLVTVPPDALVPAW
jgi:hypothetical protein